MKVALILRGGVSRISGRLLNANLVSSSSSPYVNFEACGKSLQQNLRDANPSYQFDFFIQSWNTDLRDSLNSLYSPRGFDYTENSQFSNLLSQLTRRSLQNQPKSVRERLKRQVTPDPLQFALTYAGISQALAIRKSIQLLEDTVNPNFYDLIFLARPDVMLFTPIDIQRYNEDAVYVNHYGDHMGDFHWCFTPEKRFLFKDLITSIDNGNYHQQHYWIRDFVRKFTEVSYKQDEIKAGVDEEVLRQVKYSGIPFSETARFGVKFDQYQSYDVIK